ncbi:MAG: 6-carboxytetrahydropterin synthase, partial [Cellvibrionales bacterium]|nr:6-carboxytetrahydropterin synthase [Cellvibrionales bacterium]
MKLFVNDLTVIDSSYLSDAHGLTADSWIVDLELSGDLNDMSMILDFGKIKKRIKSFIDNTIDHTLIVPARSNNLMRSYNTNTCIDFVSKKGSIHLSCPDSAFCFLETETITDSAIKTFLEQSLPGALPDNVADISIHLRHEAINSPFYH